MNHYRKLVRTIYQYGFVETHQIQAFAIVSDTDFTCNLTGSYDLFAHKMSEAFCNVV